MGGIVVGVDRSAHAVDALRFALDEARIRDAELTVVEVWQQPYLSEDVGPDAATSLDEPAHRRAEQLLQGQVAKALDGEPAPEGIHMLVRAGNRRRCSSGSAAPRTCWWSVPGGTADSATC